MNLCDYGCGEEAKFIFKNGKQCCHHSSSLCKEMKNRNSLGNKGKPIVWKNGHPKGMLGKTAWNKGMTKETDIRVKITGEKVSKKLKGKEGHLHTEETKKKLSTVIKTRYESGWMPKAGRCKKYLYESSIAGVISVDGTWELLACKYFDFLKLTWKRNTKKFEYKNLKGLISNYTPDFVINNNIYIEVKGYKTDLDRCKWKQFKDRLIIYDTNKLIKIRKYLILKNIITQETKL